MTLIEFYDSNAIENICACLVFQPDRMILVGHDRDELEPCKRCYQQILEERGISIEIDCKSISRTNLRLAVESLNRLVQKYDDCVFGLTGGEDLYLTAVGIVRGQNPDKNIQMHRFNIFDGIITVYDEAGDIRQRLPIPELDVRENILVYGGDIVQCGVTGEGTYFWKVNDELRRDVRAMWKTCKSDPKDWNAQLGVFAKAISFGKEDEDGLTIEADILKIVRELEEEGHKYTHNPRIIQQLMKDGILTRCDEEHGKLILGFKNLQVRRCMSKAGQTLELRVYLAVLDLKDENGDYVYGDVVNGAAIDWDGYTHDENAEQIYDTENEIDIVTMRGMLPIFISCKNGSVDADELFKLNTVARRFGGKYARMALVVTHMDDNKKNNYLRQRATDMDIRIIEDVQHMGDEELEKALEKCWRKLTDEEKAQAVKKPAYT